ncbi:MAG TPA: DNA gyrase subunit A [Candidatus Thermoplasmatota archaeon]|nr:DNA gyrase subunit A [Candidatus Thermoplasmatota archaeon]
MADEPTPAKGSDKARGRRPAGSGDEKAGLPAGMTPTVMAKQVVPRAVETEMRQSFLDYAMSVIVARALPDARDGLKPVHRRILYAMGELGMGPTSAYKKSARVVGEVLGKYHPHGDSSVYEAMVRMAQDWSLRYPLVDGQGNFGSVDGDGAAAMRYTEARLSRITAQLLADLEKRTVDFVPNFDATLEEPDVLPAAFPNLVVNGSAGIAVGMATNVAPHNLAEIVDATVRLIDDPAIAPIDLAEQVQGPDFPTGGIIFGRAGILSALVNGRGKIVVRGRHEVEPMGGDRERIVFTEIPYQVNKSELIIHMAELIKDKVLEGISDLRDESDRRGMRLVVELKRDAITDVVLNQLWAHTALQSTFAINNLALDGGRPKTMGLKELLQVFLRHRVEVITRRTQFDLEKAEARAHILEGLLIALSNIDAVVALIRASKDPEEALAGLRSRFSLSELQGKAILDMRLQRLTNLETGQVKEEHTGLLVQIADYKAILADPKRVDAIIKAELLKARSDYADKRRTTIEDGDVDIDDESLIPEEESVYLFTAAGYLKRMPMDTWRSQHRGGKGSRGMTTKEEDEVVETAVGSTHDWLCFFTNHGRLHWLKGHKVPTGSRAAKGKPVVNLLALEPNEIVETVIPVKDFDAPDATFLFATRNGTVKRTALSAFKNVRAGGIIAINLEEGDELLAVRRTDGKADVILATQQGQACRFDESEVRPMGRDTTGVRGITLEPGDHVVSLALAEPETSIVSVTANGYGKRTELEEYRKTHRGGKGVRTIVVNERNGPVVGVRTVHGGESMLLITKGGIVVRFPVDQLRTMGRATQGVTLMDVGEGDVVGQVAVLPLEEGEGPGAGGAANGPSPTPPPASPIN